MAKPTQSYDVEIEDIIHISANYPAGTDNCGCANVVFDLAVIPFNHKNHDYLIMEFDNKLSILHNPDCTSCKNKDNKNKESLYD